jgi:hypothetical protein
MPSSLAQNPEGDAKYIQQFEETFGKASAPAKLEEYASQARYDELYLGEKVAKSLEKVSNEQGNIAWGLSYYMFSLNEMYRVTKDTKYLKANLDFMRAVQACRDDKTGVQTWMGESPPAWSSGLYSKKGRAVFAVHTGMILCPLFEFLALAKESPEYKAELGEEWNVLLKAALETITYHDMGWREGPGANEGRYVSTRGETDHEGADLPGNWQSAMGQILWWSWKLTANTVHRDHALAVGRFIKSRLSADPDGAYYWSYTLPHDPVTAPIPKEALQGEDISHAALTASFPMLLASDGEVFPPEDMRRFANTVILGFARLNNGVLFGDVTGSVKSNPKYVAIPARWLALTPYSPEVYRRIAEFYLRYISKSPGPLDLAMLIRYRMKP